MELKKSSETSDSKRDQEGKEPLEKRISQMQRGHHPTEQQSRYLRELKENTLKDLIRDFDKAVTDHTDAFSSNDNHKTLSTLNTLYERWEALDNFHTQSTATKDYADLYEQNQYDKHQSIIDRAKEQTLQKLKDNLGKAIADYYEKDKPQIRGTNWGLINAISNLDKQIRALEEFYQKYRNLDRRSEKTKEAHKILREEEFDDFKKYIKENPDWES